MSKVSSPCTGVCQIDKKNKICLGCHRSLEQIGQWRHMSEQERKHIMATLPAPVSPEAFREMLMSKR